MYKVFFITGGCGFIGSNFIRYLLNNNNSIKIINLDKLTYAGNKSNLSEYTDDDRYHFIKGDICDKKTVKNIFIKNNPNYLINFAAESHVDRSITGPKNFIDTNIIGTFNLLQESLHYFDSINRDNKKFKFIHISTDEVYGSLDSKGKFSENTPYNPSSPYSASKASSDHLVRSWYKTFGLPILITNCSNNYGPYQFPEKLIPLMIINCLNHNPLPIYGKGENIRDWLFVEDHCDAIYNVTKNGSLGETYNIGGNNEIRNIDIVNSICLIIDKILPLDGNKSYRDFITYVKDRPGHDFRYSVDASKIKHDLNWKPNESFESGIYKTIQWYIKNQNWWKKIQEKKYNLERLGIE